jgi:hypothetical protein
MDVVDQPQQRAALLDEDALVTALEHVSPLAAETLKWLAKVPCSHAMPCTRFASGVSKARW